MTIPNLITLARLLMVPAIVVLLVQGAYGAAFAVFVIAGLSDAVDGTIARHVPGQASELGAYLDPIADKSLLVSIFITLGLIGYVPGWLVVLVVARDLLIIGGVILAWIVDRPLSIDPLKVSKFNTAAQILFASVVLADLGLAWKLDGLVDLLVWLVAGLTLASAAAYLIQWVRHMAGGEGQR